MLQKTRALPLTRSADNFSFNNKLCATDQIQKLHAVVIHELIVLTPKITVQQRKLITAILPLFLDFSVSHSVEQTFVLEKNRRKVMDCKSLSKL